MVSLYRKIYHFKKLVLTSVLTILLAGVSIVIFRSSATETELEIFNYSNDTTPELSIALGYDKYIKEEIDSMSIVGLAYTIVHNDQEVLTRTYGVKEVGTNDSIDTKTIFRLASVSKGFAGILACLLEEEGILSLSEKIKTHIPGFELKDSVNTTQLTIENMLSHTSGLVPHAYDNLAEAGMTMAQIIPRLPEVDISDTPGKLYGYQNVVFSLLDTIVNVNAGKDYNDLMAEKLFEPLGMQYASSGQKQIHNSDSNLALPHIFYSGAYHSTPPNQRYYNVSPAAGVNASISDMTNWLLALLGNCPEFLDSAVLNKIETPVIETPLKRTYTYYWGHVDEKYYSLGWRIYEYKGMKIMYHGGYVLGYRSEIAYCPEEKIGIAVLQNSTGSLASKSIPEFFNRWIENRSITDTLLATVQKNELTF